MKKNIFSKETLILTLLVFISTLFYEYSLRVFVNNEYLSLVILRLAASSIFLSSIVILVLSLFNDKYKKAILSTYLILMPIIFIIQITYKDLMGKFVNLTLLTEAERGAEFIGIYVSRLKLAYLIFFIPLIIFLLYFKKKKIEIKGNIRNTRILLLCIAILSCLFIFGTLNMSSFENEYSIYTDKELYENPTFFDLAIYRFGLLTSARLDITYFILGNEVIDEPVISDNEEKDNKDEEKNVEYDYNILNDLDLEELINNEENEQVKNLHLYFKNADSTIQNDKTGIFKDKNLILILAESLDEIAIHPEVTPTLYKMTKESYYFNNYYSPIMYKLTTGDAQFIVDTSLAPDSKKWSINKYNKNDYHFSLPNLFNEIGYYTSAYHNWNDRYYNRGGFLPNLGYNDYFDIEDLKIKNEFHPNFPSDIPLVEKSLEHFINEDKFFSYIISVSGHLPYSKGQKIAKKNWEYVKDLEVNNKTKSYYAAIVEFDRALEKLLEELENNGKLDDTVIAVYADHYPYGLTKEEVQEASTRNRDKYYNIHRVPFFIWSKDIEPEVIEKPVSNFDVLPTLANLFGLEYDSRFMFGKDVFSDSEHIVTFADSSWLTEKGRFNALTGNFEPFGEAVDGEYIKKINDKVKNRLGLSVQMLKNDYFSKIFDKNE